MGPTPAPHTSVICEEKAQLEYSYREAKAAFDTARTAIRQKVGRASRPNTGGWPLRRIPPETTYKMSGGSLLHTFENTDAE